MVSGFSVGVIGSGPVGRAISTLLARPGYHVELGTRRPGAAALDDLPDGVSIGTFEDAAACDVVFLAVVHRASRDLVTELSALLAGKVLIDVDNAWLPGDREAAGLSASLTEGRWMSQLLPETTVVRALSHIDWDLLLPTAIESPGIFAAPYLTDDDRGAAIIEALFFDMGYVPVRIGGLDDPALDIGGRLWPGLYTVDQLMIALRGEADSPSDM